MKKLYIVLSVLNVCLFSSCSNMYNNTECYEANSGGLHIPRGKPVGYVYNAGYSHGINSTARKCNGCSKCSRSKTPSSYRVTCYRERVY